MSSAAFFTPAGDKKHIELQDAGVYPADQRLFKEDRKLAHNVALHYMHDNFCRVRQSLRVTPAMQAKIADHVWEIEELVALLDLQWSGHPFGWLCPRFATDLDRVELPYRLAFRHQNFIIRCDRKPPTEARPASDSPLTLPPHVG